ncbi:MAG: glycosyltransferase family 2 protein [Actinomycetia bacterium]|nr:glycosyltransferase family 2 protein [Actinomycetes bacterium]
MPDAPRFSVTIPAYNAEATLAETVSSVTSQTFSDWELVIVNDGSTDGTRALAERFAATDPRIRVVSQENRGSGGAYNTAVRTARADLLVMLSADDLLMPGHLAAFDAFIDAHPEADVFTCDGYYEYDDGRAEPSTLHEDWASPEECTLSDLLVACFYNMGAAYRRRVFDAVGGFREDLYAEDYLFYLLALAMGFRHRRVPERLSVHRRSSAQKSASHIRVRRADVAALEAVLATGLLDKPAQSIARRVIAHHRRTIAVRVALAALLGQERSTRVLDRLLGRSAS